MPPELNIDIEPLTGLTFQFQPILGADGRSLLAFEALARRTRRDGTIEGPAAILPSLLCPERIEEFTCFSLGFALTRLRKDPYLPALSVNLSPRQIELEATVKLLRRAPQALRRRLMIELTEDPIVDHPGLPFVLQQLAAMGVSIYLDDVTPCTLQRLATLRGAVHGLKLDRSQVTALAAPRLTEGAAKMLDAALETGLTLVAEGVEDENMLQPLAARGVAYFQGFALGEPWSEPKVARRRILTPRNHQLQPDPGLVSALSSVAASKHI